MIELSSNQRYVFMALCEYIEARGMAPTMRELGQAALVASSLCSVVLDVLEARGLVLGLWVGGRRSSRGLVVTPAGWALYAQLKRGGLSV